MRTRQATKLTIILLALLAGLSACAPSDQPLPTLTPLPPTSAPEPTITFTASPPTETPTPTPLTCLTQPGRVEEGLLESTKPPQAYFIYIPPCYDEKTDIRYPVLYLLHGQTYTADQWIRLGAVQALDDLILSGETMPFIIVFPDDRYWNLPPGAGFGARLVDDLIPYIDSTYRTLPDRNHRAIGGLSRGAGWSFRLGFSRWDLFSVIGLHSLAVLQNDRSRVGKWIADIPPDSYPSIFMDIGDNDQELNMARTIESQLNDSGLSHEWHYYRGAHTEEYWRAHVDEYIAWYAEQWNNP
ncbi:MAG TPA: alpha/beta hydrolase-fold protein [Anaerolineales bacterium]|nr:alpha/beta hydrolase-fold protein [Anaerolineales bacterium]